MRYLRFDSRDGNFYLLSDVGKKSIGPRIETTLISFDGVITTFEGYDGREVRVKAITMNLNGEIVQFAFASIYYLSLFAGLASGEKVMMRSCLFKPETGIYQLVVNDRVPTLTGTAYISDRGAA